MILGIGLSFHGGIKMLILNLVRCLCLFQRVFFDSFAKGFRKGLFLNLISIDFHLVLFLSFLVLLFLFFLIFNLFRLLVFLLCLLVVLLESLFLFILFLFRCFRFFSFVKVRRLNLVELVKQTVINLFFIFVNFLDQNLNFWHYCFFFAGNFWFFKNDLYFLAILFFIFIRKQL